MPTPSEYTDNIEDMDNDSFTNPKTAELIDNVIATGMINAEFSYDCLPEEVVEEICSELKKNPMNVTLKVPSIGGGMLTANFRCSKRKTKMLKTGSDEDTSKSWWTLSFSIMQKAPVGEQINS